MNAINQKNISRRIFKAVLPLFVILLVQSGIFAQAPPDSVFCANDGQVCAFDGEREVIYGAKGTFIRKVIKGGSVCLPPTFGIEDPLPNVLKSCYIVNSATAVDLSGTWAMFEGNGKKYEKNAVITQNGASVTLNNGYGSQATENLVGSKLSVRTWKLTGTVSADGKRIDWSNGFYWVKNDLWDRPQILSLEEKAKQETSPVTENKKEIVWPEAGKLRRLITIKNKSGFNISGNLIMRFDYDSSDNKNDVKSNVTTGGLMSGQGETLNVPFDTKTDYELWIRLDGNKPLFIATLPKNEDLTTFCYEVTGTYFVPVVKTCDGGTTYEAKYISFKNEAGFNSTMSLTYYPLGKTTTRTATTLSTTAGYQTKIYLPMDADTERQMILKVKPEGGGELLSRNVSLNDFNSTCYKVWGIIGTPKVGACSLNSNARKIKFWNNAGYSAKMQVTYDSGQMVETNFIEVTETETIEIPNSTSNNSVKISLVNKWSGKEISTFSTSADFTGELCYKVEGTTISPTAATCDDTVGDTSGDTRQIRFQNDAGYDAQMVVSYFEDQVINGTTMAMPKILVTGLINGLGGKFRLVTIPKNTSKGQPITIALQGNSTVKNDIWSTTLPADFAASPQPCFKVWGTLFEPQGGKCSQ
jgi:hypothetical protein